MRGPAASIAAAAVVIAAAYSALLRRRPAPSRLALAARLMGRGWVDRDDRAHADGAPRACG